MTKMTTNQWKCLENLTFNQKNYLISVGIQTVPRDLTREKSLRVIEEFDRRGFITTKSLEKVHVEVYKNNNALTQGFAFCFNDGRGVGEPLIMALVAIGWLRIDKDRYVWLRSEPFNFLKDKRDFNILTCYSCAFSKPDVMSTLRIIALTEKNKLEAISS